MIEGSSDRLHIDRLLGAKKGAAVKHARSIFETHDLSDNERSIRSSAIWLTVAWDLRGQRECSDCEQRAAQSTLACLGIAGNGLVPSHRHHVCSSLASRVWMVLPATMFS